MDELGGQFGAEPGGQPAFFVPPVPPAARPSEPTDPLPASDWSSNQMTRDFAARRRSPRHRRYLPVLATACALGLVAAVLGLSIGAGGKSVPGSGMDPAAFVVSATSSTLAHKTAHLVLSGDVKVDGQTVALSGSGQADFTTQQMQMTARFAAGGHTVGEQEVLVGGQLYLLLTVDGQNLAAQLTGKNWVTIPIPVGSTSSVGAGTSDPLSELQMLGARGNTVSSLGTSTIDGTSVSGYAVTISKQNLIRVEQQFASSSGFPAEVQQSIVQQAENAPPMTMDVWFDGSNLLRRMQFTTRATQNGSSVAVVVDADLVDYGAPVSPVTAPSSGDVVSFSDFLSASQAAASSVG